MQCNPDQEDRLKRMQPVTRPERNQLAKLVHKYGAKRIKELIPIVRLRRRGRPSKGDEAQREAAHFSLEVDKLAKEYHAKGQKAAVKRALLDVAKDFWPEKSLALETLRRKLGAGRKYRNDHSSKPK